MSLFPEFSAQEANAAFKTQIPYEFEPISETLYSYQDYPTAGFAKKTFFQDAIGGTNNLTESDTNMEIASMLPEGTGFLVQGIACDFILPESTLIADTALYAQEFHKIMNAKAFVKLKIAAGEYGTWAPLKRLPMPQQIALDLATGSDETIGVARTVGAIQLITPKYIGSKESFNVQLQFDSAQAITSAGRIGFHLLGTKYRNVSR